MEIILKPLSYLLVGFVEMFLITQRTFFISKGRNKTAAGIVFIENFIAFFIIWQLAQNVGENIPSFLAYTIGSCSGTVINIENLTIEKIMKKLRKVRKWKTGALHVEVK